TSSSSAITTSCNLNRTVIRAPHQQESSAHPTLRSTPTESPAPPLCSALPAEAGLEALQPWARRAFEGAYRRRPREQASREDIAYGFIEALCWAQVSSAFRPDNPSLTDLGDPVH